jgi:hypothetical protein
VNFPCIIVASNFPEEFDVSWNFSSVVFRLNAVFGESNIMHEHQQDSRIAAARAFMESLEQLKIISASEHQTTKSDSQIWEEAAADLDAFLGDDESLQAEMFDRESDESR